MVEEVREMGLVCGMISLRFGFDGLRVVSIVDDEARSR